MSKFSKNFQKVTFIKHWSENLFSFCITRPKGFKFRSGEFVMIGLVGSNDKPILRAYSICSPSWSEELEFYSIIVKDGPLTSKLKNIKIGDEVIVIPKSTGTLVLDALRPGKRLFLLSSGTGFAPFAALIREPETYERFESIIITHTCRTITELILSNKLFNDLKINSISSNDRFMFCGSMGLNNDLKKIMLENNFREGANNHPGEFVLEKAFVG